MRHSIELLQGEFADVSRISEDYTGEQYDRAMAVLADLELAINALILLESQLDK